MLIPHRIYIALPAIPGSFGLGIVEHLKIIDYHELQTFHPKPIDNGPVTCHTRGIPEKDSSPTGAGQRNKGIGWVEANPSNLRSSLEPKGGDYHSQDGHL